MSLTDTIGIMKYTIDAFYITTSPSWKHMRYPSESSETCMEYVCHFSVWAFWVTIEEASALWSTIHCRFLAFWFMILATPFHFLRIPKLDCSDILF